MKTKKVFSAILGIVLVCNVFAQNYPTGSLLWKISGNGLEQDSYLFGTYHGSTDISNDFLDSIPGFDKAFDSVSQFIMETTGVESMEGIKTLFEEFGAPKMPDDVFYADLLQEADIVYLDSIVMKYLGCKSSEVRANPNFLLGIIAQLKQQENYTGSLDENAQEIMDSHLMKRAAEKECSLESLDTPGVYKRFFKQMWFGDHIPETFQEGAVNLMKYLRNSDQQSQNKELNDVNVDFVNAYREQNLNRLLEIKKEQLLAIDEMNPDRDMIRWVEDFLLEERNKLWMEKIPELVKKESTFIAVGALHLCGEQGLLHQLKLAGYTVEAVQ